MVHRFHAADLLRGLAAFSVVVWHYKDFFLGRPWEGVLLPFYANGQLAVDLFFVISGFVLMHVYGDRVSDLRSFGAFVGRRIARLVPLQLLTLAAVASFYLMYYFIFGIYGSGIFYDDLYHFVLNMFLIQYVGLQKGWSFNIPSWTISGEFWINVLFGILLLLARRAILLISLAIVAASAPVMIFMGYSGRPFLVGGWLEPLLVRTAAGFFTGVITYYIWQRWPVRSNLPLYAGLVAFTSLMLYGRQGPNLVLVEAFCVLLAAPLLVYGAAASPLGDAVGDSADGRWFGGISYSVYLWQFPLTIVLVSAGAREWPHQVVFPLYVTLLFTIATISWRWFEMPARALINRAFSSRKAADDEFAEKAARAA